ncbi:ABC transporter G family member 4-like, partial [Dioscorea cayenensis subsp. rotundata]|uniref:ABC transporter G family member 4-like n=1 Tax=Dioscorea cayennensis subsp. rotundata TaxID=55577 RepID=A0AB40B8D8_DIOCR
TSKNLHTNSTLHLLYQTISFFSTPPPPLTPRPPPSSILHNISFTAYPSQLLAIVGPSGAGKSTLLDILSARTSPTSGHLLLNSTPLRPSLFRRISSHVPQHDLFLPLLTVSETFTFTASLLLPSSSSPSSISSTVSSLLSSLHLSHLSHSLLSSSLSGGERRRISIGLSLLSDPSILLLDEPTSGLDSSTAFSLLLTLRSLSLSRHRTIILSIHQPSSKLLSTIDSILLLSNGSLLHHGDLHSLSSLLLSSGFPLPSQLNPLEYAMELLSHLHSSSSSSPPDPPLTNIPSHNHNRHLCMSVTYTSSRPHEILTLYSRSWKLIYRTRQLLLTNTIEALGVGFLLGTIYINMGYTKQGIDKRLGLFAFTLTFLLSSTTETLPIFVGERPILLREASSGLYRLSSHLFATTMVFIPYLLCISLLYSASVYFLVGLCFTWEAFSCFVLIVWVVVLTANSFVLFVSSLAPDYIAGTSLVMVSLAGFFLFSGYFISMGSMPSYWLFAHYLSPYKYALDALLENEYGCAAARCFEREDGVSTCMVTGADVLARRGLKEGQRWVCIEVLFGFFFVYRLLYWLVLSRRASMCKK